MRRNLLFGAAAFVATLSLVIARAPAGVEGPPSPGDPLTRPAPERREFAREQLPNGLEVLVESRPNSPSVACRVFVKTGSLFEAEYLGCGISHLVEHLVSGGATASRTEKETERLLASMGAASNAYTTYDVTCYYITTTSEHYATALDLLASWMRDALFDPRALEREIEVVQREIETDEDDPRDVLGRLYAETALLRSPARVPVIGFKENLRRLSREDVVRYYRSRYVPNNALVAVVGEVDVEEALEAVRKAFGPWERRPLAPVPLPAEPEQVSPRRAERELAVNVTCARLGWPTVDLFDPDLYALDALASVLARGEASRLVAKLVREMRLANSVDASSWTPAFGPGSLTVQLEVEDGARLEQAIAAVLAELQRLKSEPISADELARVKRQIFAEHVFTTQSNEGRAEDLAGNVLWTGDPFFSEHYVSRIQALSADDLLRVARRYVLDERLTVAVVRPKAPASAPPARAVSEPPRPGIRRIQLDNGLVVLLKNLPGTRIVSIRACFRGGVLAETPKTNGLFHLLAKTMARATARFETGKLARMIDSLGGRLAGESGYHSFGVEASFLGQDLGTALEIVSSILIEPSFPPEELEREKWNARYLQASAEDDWQSEGTYFLREAIFGSHPYALRPFGTPESISGIDRASILEAHRRYTTPGNGVLAVFGEIDLAEAERQIRERFGSWRGGAPELPQPPLPPPLEKPATVTKIARTDQTTIALGYPGLSMESGDRYALELIDAVTSGIGIPSGALHEALRGGEKGLVYFVHAINWMGIDCGVYYVLTRCAPENEKAVLDSIREVERALCERELSDEELARGKAIVLTAMKIANETPAMQAEQAALFELYGLGCDFFERYPARIEAVTKKDVLRVASRIFGPSVLAIVRPEKRAGEPAPDSAKSAEEGLR